MSVMQAMATCQMLRRALRSSPAPRNWPASVAATTMKALPGRKASDSIVMATEWAAAATSPRLLTIDKNARWQEAFAMASTPAGRPT
jgi:hypothetical protein